MKKFFFLSFGGIVFFAGCTKPRGDAYTSVQIHYIDKAGNDLFTDGQNGFVKDSVKEYGFEKGIKTLMVAPTKTIDYPWGYFSPFFSSWLIVDGGVNDNNDIVNGYTNNIIHLKNGVDDTLRVHLTGSQQIGSIYDKIWYNGKLKRTTDLPPDSATNSDLFTIVH